MPTFNLARWLGHLTTNNCYAYALDRVGTVWMGPGEPSGLPPMIGQQACTSYTVSERAVRDGLVPIASPAIVQPPDWPVALVIAPPQNRMPGGDYHWYRRDDNMIWSHKVAQLAPSMFDELGYPITDPSLCHRGSYIYFVGFFRVPALRPVPPAPPVIPPGARPPGP